MKKILLFGPEVSDFLNPLAVKLKNLGYQVDLLENRKVHRNNIAIKRSYSNVFNYNQITGERLTIPKLFRYLFSLKLYLYFIKTLFFNHIAGKINFVKSLRNSFSYQNTKDIFTEFFSVYDVISFHSLNTQTLMFVNFVSPKTKVILSYWGSDLFQIWGNDIFTSYVVRNHYIESQALKRADVITVTGHEMARTVIAKFGSIVKAKMVHLLFGVDDEIFDKIDQYKKDKPHREFLNKFSIPEDKIKITVGYCGDPICNHLPILNELSKINSDYKKKIHLLVPMTYGNFTKEYAEAVIQKLIHSEISYTVFDKYLTKEDLLKLRVTSDVMIIMNKSDALSVSVREALYAENLLISAIWLPYSTYRLAGIFFYETDFDRLNERIIFQLNNFNEIKSHLAGNPSKIKKLTALSETLPGWMTIFDDGKKI